MPRKPINYDNTHIYRLVCKDPTITECYVGHTTDFNSRRQAHKTRSLNPRCTQYNTPVYIFIRANGGIENSEMILIETISCTTAIEARREERRHTEALQASLNCQVPSRTHKEYYAENRETISVKHKAYKKQNKEATAATGKHSMNGTRKQF